MKYSVVLPGQGRYVESARRAGALAWWPEIEQARTIARVVGGQVVRTQRFMALLDAGHTMKGAASAARPAPQRVHWTITEKGYRLLDSMKFCGARKGQ
jgi:hypothetical protein